jgi:hypothetical protein
MLLDADKKVDSAFKKAQKIFLSKMGKYGPAWIGFSFLGFADQIFIKAYRYKTLVHIKNRKISDPPEFELYAIINYCVLFLIARNKEIVADIFPSPTSMFEPPTNTSKEKLIFYYNDEIKKTTELHKKKDHDYGSAWQSLSKQGIADIIFSKVVRMKAMLSSGKAPTDDQDSDGIAATLRDLINYAAFALALDQNFQ